MAWACIGVGRSYPRRANGRQIDGVNPSLEKDIEMILCDPTRFPAALKGECATSSHHHGANSASEPQLRNGFVS